MKRSEVAKELTWDLSDLVSSKDDFKSKYDEVLELNKSLKSLKGTIKDEKAIHNYTKELNQLMEKFEVLSSYAEFCYCVDGNDEEAFKIVTEVDKLANEITLTITDLENELMSLDDDIISLAMENSEDAFVYLRSILKSKKRKLSDDVENALVGFKDVWRAPNRLYDTIKASDIRFPQFSADGKEYPMTFGYFEERYESNKSTELRRKAHEVFYNTMRNYQSTLAENYNTHLKIDKAMSKLRGFDSVFDYLLDKQDVTRESYERHVDAIKNELPIVMRKYAKKIKEKYKLDKMTSADLKAPLFYEMEKEVSIDEAKDILKEGLAILGDDYVKETLKYINNRWIDFAENEGKATGAFCADVHGVHSYVLISWTGAMEDAFVLAHELGHAGHGRYTMRNNSILNSSSSLYTVECPSTMNEMLLANNFIKKAEDEDMKNWVYSQMIERTYYHNFVTHGIEAIFQREVLRIIDRGDSVNASILNELFGNILREFWGDEVEIIDGAELTWTRQPHYFMGLYPFTYQAGLSIATNVFLKIRQGDENIIGEYKEVLKSGGKYLPKEWAAHLGVDIEGDFISKTIDYIGELVDSIK
ncbi:MAG: M3 family metallopeptidase [Ezakiella sp.]|nr:M3 family metallopeptidase [Ezakiella sp.]